MELITDWEHHQAVERMQTVFSIGVFDGLHLGHKHLVDMVIKKAAKLKVASLVLTFDPHPLEVLAPTAAPPALTTLQQKVEILSDWGLDRLGVIKFNREVASISPQNFLFQFLDKFIDPVVAVLGPDFTFGQGAKGNAETIIDWLGRTNPKARVLIADPRRGKDGVYSSSQIRQNLKSGLVELAAKSLGRPYRLQGRVIHGQARGRNLGFPTANLGHIHQLIPAPGVYAVRVNLDDGVYGGMTSIGFNPTFNSGIPESQPLTVETNIFDFDRFIYNQELSLDFMVNLREMIRFKSPEQLVRQLEKDRQNAQLALPRPE